jgi:hypothetical protein
VPVGGKRIEGVRVTLANLRVLACNRAGDTVGSSVGGCGQPDADGAAPRSRVECVSEVARVHRSAPHHRRTGDGGGDSTSPANTVLWIMRIPRDGPPLTIEARPVHADMPLIRLASPADSSPGEIYPSYVNVPKAGCWRLTLHWARQTNPIDLRYRA